MTKEKMGKQDIVDGWSHDGQTFIHFGQGYRLKKDLSQVCVGAVGRDGEALDDKNVKQGMLI
jgi:hypothetical protein